MPQRELFDPVHIYAHRGRITPYIRNTYFRSLIYRLWVYIKFEFAKRKYCITKNERQIASLKNKHKGKRCFIIGNGPSLKISDLDKLKNEITFAANKIYLAFDQTDWRPTYYSVTDYMVAQQNYSEINRLQGFEKLFPVFAKERWGTHFKNSIYFRYEYSTKRFPEPPYFSLNPFEKIYAGKTIIYALIQIACYMGIREIYLIGIDFNFKVPDKKNDHVLYSEGECNHFHPQYRKKGEKWRDPQLDYQQKAFQVAKESVANLGGQIFNATRGGKLEVFPRIDFDSLF